MLRQFGFAIALLASSPAFAVTAVDRLDTLLSETKTWSAEFVQTVVDEKQRPLQTSRGTVYIHRPGRFRWDYAAPAPQLIVADGIQVWVYDKELEQVTVRPLDKTLGNTPALLLMHAGSVSEVFALTSLGRRGELDWIELVPKTAGSNFERLRLAIDARQIRIMEMADSFGQMTELRFADAAVNVAIDPALFSFTPPQGVDVIDGR